MQPTFRFPGTLMSKWQEAVYQRLSRSWSRERYVFRVTSAFSLKIGLQERCDSIFRTPVGHCRNLPAGSGARFQQIFISPVLPSSTQTSMGLWTHLASERL